MHYSKEAEEMNLLNWEDQKERASGMGRGAIPPPYMQDLQEDLVGWSVLQFSKYTGLRNLIQDDLGHPPLPWHYQEFSPESC